MTPTTELTRIDAAMERIYESVMLSPMPESFILLQDMEFNGITLKAGYYIAGIRQKH